MADEIRRMQDYTTSDINDNIAEVREARGEYDSLDERLNEIEGRGPSPSNPIASNCVSPMTGYSKSSSSTPGDINTNDTLNAAIGKLEKRTELNENNISKCLALEGGTALTSTADLNNITTIGNYYCSSNTTGQTIANRPTGSSGAFRLTVYFDTGTQYPSQLFDDFSTRKKWERKGNGTGTTFESWGLIIDNLADYQKKLSSTTKANADYIDDTSSTHKFATAAQLSQIEINENNILSEQAKTTGMTEGGSDYITVNGIRIYVTATAPTGARTGDLWIGGSSIKKKSENLFDKDTADMQNIYIYTDDTFVHENQNTISVVFPCQPNTTYTISKTISSRFVIGYTNTYPQNGTTAYSINADNTATTLSITTGSNAEYIVILIVYTPQETKTTQEILDSIMINDWT